MIKKGESRGLEILPSCVTFQKKVQNKESDEDLFLLFGLVICSGCYLAHTGNSNCVWIKNKIIIMIIVRSVEPNCGVGALASMHHTWPLQRGCE